jgi:hypothetical protein
MSKEYDTRKNSIESNNTGSTANSSDQGSTDNTNSYNLKRFSEADIKDREYLSSFYKYVEGGTFETKTVRVPECTFENYTSKDSAYGEIQKMTKNPFIILPIYNENGIRIKDVEFNTDHVNTGQFNKLGKKSDTTDKDIVPDIIPYNYIIFAINGNKIEGFFVGNCIFNEQDVRFISNNQDEPASILHNKLGFPIQQTKNYLRSNHYLLNNNETTQYLKNYKNKLNNDSFKERWLVFKLEDNDECKKSIDVSTLQQNKNTSFLSLPSVFSKFFAGSRSKKSQRKHKSKKYARKTIRKHKSRKNRK